MTSARWSFGSAISAVAVRHLALFPNQSSTAAVTAGVSRTGVRRGVAPSAMSVSNVGSVRGMLLAAGDGSRVVLRAEHRVRLGVIDGEAAVADVHAGVTVFV